MNAGAVPVAAGNANANPLKAILSSRALPAIGAPLLIVMVLAMMLVPLAPMVLDLLFSFNIALALVVLVVASQTRRVLDFASFPALLLVTTLLRLALNVASTRAVLLDGHTGPAAAGHVIEAFARFLIGGSFAVGIVVFTILTIINFVVVTKGAGRIAEVSARFALDAMPGKQMAIDADLAAGSVDEAQARRRRLQVTQEAEFYGSMDGASKFVRGDAIAGILILLVNIAGGIAIGTLQHGMSFEAAAGNYVLLAIGDGLVAQVPSLVISVAAGLVVARVGEDDIGRQIGAQLFAAPRAIALAGGVLAVLGLVPGMPHMAFLALASGCGALAWGLSRAHARRQAPAAASADADAARANGEAGWSDVVPVDAIALEVGFRLIALVDESQGGELLSRVRGVRRKFASEVGFVPPTVHIRDNLELHPGAYRILVKGAVVAEGQLQAGQFLAINPGYVQLALPGTPTTDPAFGLPSVWIDAREREQAGAAGYTVVDACTVLATHLNHVMQTHAAALLGRGELNELLEHARRHAGALVDDTVPKIVALPLAHKVLRNLLDESVHLRDVRTVLEALAEHGPVVQDADELTRQVRIALGPAIVNNLYGGLRELPVLAVEPGLEQVLVQGLSAQAAAPLDPSLGELLAERVGHAAQQQEAGGQPACLLVPDRIRAAVARMVRRRAPRLHVLAHSEIPRSHSIRIQQVIGAVT